MRNGDFAPSRIIGQSDAIIDLSSFALFTHRLCAGFPRSFAPYRAGAILSDNFENAVSLITTGNGTTPDSSQTKVAVTLTNDHDAILQHAAAMEPHGYANFVDAFKIARVFLFLFFLYMLSFISLSFF